MTKLYCPSRNPIRESLQRNDAALHKRAAQPTPTKTLPILMYHDICNDTTGSHPYAISKDTFERQLQYLQEHNYKTILLTEYLDLAFQQQLEPNQTVILTFDDTHRNNYTNAYQLLQKYGFTATFFIITQLIGKGEDLLDREHIAEMATTGMSIQSHTHTHAFLDDLSHNILFSELEVSKHILETIVNREVTIVSCPGGRFDRNTVTAAEQTEYKAICTSHPAMRRYQTNMYLLGRLLITRNTDVHAFAHIIGLKRTYVLNRVLQYYLKHSLRKALGNTLYHRVWRLTTSTFRGL